MTPKDKISQILEDIEFKKQELLKEYEKIKKKYDFSLEKGRIKFTRAAKKYQSRFKIPLIKYVASPTLRHTLSIPFIYAIFIPVAFLDIALFIYQQTAMRLYKIPLVVRKDYFNLDRKHLAYLNIIQKINCIYCSYMNGLFAFAVEVGARTEKYWCPIKSAQVKPWEHKWEKKFADYGDPKGFEQIFNNHKEFTKKK